LTKDEKKHIEEGFRDGTLTVICCTSTLAAGVNLPASRVIIRSPYVGKNFLTLSLYKQMVGRAGRAGKVESGESYIICDVKDQDNLRKMLTSQMDHAVSGFANNPSLYSSLLLNLIGTKQCKSYADILEFSKCMLVYIQEKSDAGNVLKTLTETLNDMLKNGTVRIDSYISKNLNIICKYVVNGDVQQNERNLYPDDILNINKLGKAAVNSGMKLEDAQRVENDLEQAHQNLVLSQCLHLLYIVVPHDSIKNIKLDFMTFNHLFMKMKPSMIHTASIIGISEALAMRVGRNQSASETELVLIKRFYIAMILNELWNGKDFYNVCKIYNINRGLLHKIMSATSSNAYSIYRFCEIYDHYWVFKEILEKFSKRLAYCCSVELLPLMELPNVKMVSNISKIKFSKIYFLFLGTSKNDV
jgi:POLQ-like helicase